MNPLLTTKAENSSRTIIWSLPTTDSIKLTNEKIFILFRRRSEFWKHHIIPNTNIMLLPAYFFR